MISQNFEHRNEVRNKNVANAQKVNSGMKFDTIMFLNNNAIMIEDHESLQSLSLDRSSMNAHPLDVINKQQFPTPAYFVILFAVRDRDPKTYN